jgi:hypothetical protein
MRPAPDIPNCSDTTVPALFLPQGRLNKPPELEGEEARQLTLLTIACGKPVDPAILGATGRAGEERPAAMHLPSGGCTRSTMMPHDTSSLPKGWMAEGVSPRVNWTALEFDPEPLDRLESVRSRPVADPTDETFDLTTPQLKAAATQIRNALDQLHSETGRKLPEYFAGLSGQSTHLKKRIRHSETESE